MTHSRLQALDGWRGVAILAVLFGHFATARGLNAGRLGVELFFALSGLLIGKILFEARTGIGPFAVNRFARIVPSMWVFWIVAMAVVALREGRPPADGLPAALGFGNYVLGLPHRIDHLWSIGVELQGYAFLALVAALSRHGGPSPRWLILGFVAGCWAYTAGLAWRGEDAYYATYWRFESRSTAMLLSAALMAGPRALPGGALAWPLWAALGIALQASPVPDLFKYTLGSACLSLGCVGLADSPAPPRWLTARWLVALGEASYSLYLWQQLFFYERETLGRLTALALALAAGFLAHHAWDVRLHRAARRRLSGLLLRRARQRA